jgi:hypothetical protein
MKLTTHLHVTLGLRVSGAVPSHRNNPTYCTVHSICAVTFIVATLLRVMSVML